MWNFEKNVIDVLFSVEYSAVEGVRGQEDGPPQPGLNPGSNNSGSPLGGGGRENNNNLGTQV